MTECCVYEINTLRGGICLNVLYIILLKWEMIYFSMLFIWYYWNESWFNSESCVYAIIKMRSVICMNAVYMMLLK